MAEDVRPLSRLIESFGVQRIHIHHTLGWPLDVRLLIQSLGVPFDFTVHDFFAICPRVRLTTPDHKYCGGPASRDALNVCPGFLSPPRRTVASGSNGEPGS